VSLCDFVNPSMTAWLSQPVTGCESLCGCANPSPIASLRGGLNRSLAVSHCVVDLTGYGLCVSMFLCVTMWLRVTVQEVEELFASVDENADGVIDFDEYMRLMTNRLHETNKEDGMALAYNLLTDKRTVSARQYSTVQYSTVQHRTVLYRTVRHSTVQYSTAQHSTVRYSKDTVQDSTVLY